MYIIVDLIVFVLTCRVFIGLFVILMSLEGMRDIHRRLIVGEYSHRPPSGVRKSCDSVGIRIRIWVSQLCDIIKLFSAVGYDRIFGGSHGGWLGGIINLVDKRWDITLSFLSI
jgi:hypothetical protein